MTILNEAGTLPGGTFTLADDLTLTRVGYGAMQLAGPHVFGPPKDRDAAIAVLREVVAIGINHIDTADLYGPHITNQLIHEALSPYPEQLHLVTKIGGRRGADGSWDLVRTPEALVEQTHDNLRNLGLEKLEVVNLRLGTPAGPEAGSLAEPLGAMIEMKQQGMIGHIGLSTVTLEQVREAQAMTEIVCVQNLYNIANRGDDAMIDELAKEGIAYVPYFPLGGFSPLQSSELHSVAERLGVTPMAVALAWLLQRSPNILLIPGTSSVAHLRENVAGAGLELPADAVAELNKIGTDMPAAG